MSNTTQTTVAVVGQVLVYLAVAYTLIALIGLRTRVSAMESLLLKQQNELTELKFMARHVIDPTADVVTVIAGGETFTCTGEWVKIKGTP